MNRPTAYGVLSAALSLLASLPFAGRSDVVRTGYDEALPQLDALSRSRGPLMRVSGRFTSQPPRSKGHYVRTLPEQPRFRPARNAGQIQALGLGRRHARIPRRRFVPRQRFV